MLCKKLLLVLFLFLNLFPVAGQDRGFYDYSRELSWGITKATNSGLIGGFIGKYSIRKGERTFHYFGLEMVNVKHPKEERYYSFTGNTFIYGKSNYLYNIRTYYGRDWILYKKAPQQGIQINGLIGAGPTIGIVAPYYIEYYLSSQGVVISEQYDAEKHDNRENILGTGNLFQGLGKSDIVMGLNFKAALSYEFGTVKFSIVGIETGFMIEAFTQEIPIIPTAENFQVFPNAYVTLYYGTRK